MLLADAAQAVGGKLYLIGGGWDTLAAADAPASVYVAGMLVREPSDSPGEYPLSVVLLDGSGSPVSWSKGDPTHVVARGVISVVGETKREENQALAMGFHGVVLAEGEYVWRLTVGDVLAADLRFRVVNPLDVSATSLRSP